MIYLKNFRLVDGAAEYDMILYKKNIHNTLYPLNIFPEKQLERLEFDSITIFYGGNGSGKTTLLNMIGETLQVAKKNKENLGDLFHRYTKSCHYEFLHESQCREKKYISSDDVFDYLLDIRAMNSRINRRKDQLTEEYYEYRNTAAKEYLSRPDRYDELENKIDADKMTVSKYIRTRLRNNTVVQESNGETALEYWQNEIQDHALYLIDEPENSLSAQNQLKFKTFIEESARFYNCQFIIATHSPFLLALQGARIYDLDSVPVQVKKWTELENVKLYYEFFKEHSDEFK